MVQSMVQPMVQSIAQSMVQSMVQSVVQSGLRQQTETFDCVRLPHEMTILYCNLSIVLTLWSQNGNNTWWC